MSNLFNYLPIVIILIAFSVVFFIFIFGIFILLRSRGDELEEQKAKNIIIKSFYLLIVVFAGVLVFFLVSYLIKRGEAFLPPQASGDFPVSPLSTALPPRPEFISINGYGFSAPIAIKIQNNISGPAFFAVLCSQGYKYDIMQIGSVNKAVKFDFSEGTDNYKCWLANCGNNANDIFVSSYSLSSQAYQTGIFEKMTSALKGKITSSCGGI